MAETIRVGIIGGGWPGAMHARGYLTAGSYKIVAVADLIPERRKKLMAEYQIAREYAGAESLIADRDIDAVSVCLPNTLHAPVALAALRGGKHVLCETPPSMSAKEARRMATAAQKHGKVLLYGLQRRYGGHEQAAKLAIAKGFVGDAYHVRCVWTRTRGIPVGTGWFTQKQQAGGGALFDIGTHMLDIGWYLLGQPKPISAYGMAYTRFANLVPQGFPFDVDDQAFALIRFENGRSLELAVSWALNQPQHQNGTVCRVYGTEGAIDVYTPQGAVLCRDFNADGRCKVNPLKPPKTTHHTALIRHFKECITGKATPCPGGAEGVTLMEMLEAIYRSSETEKSVSL
ncbi:MAG TPA: Gfo/Idh/MocA family oxidoreductase [Tepidisphaeraceae bacterium]|nr:Gfo/Idh/MocA family oxidoreductase [Tepidisphaeraceae bacterium]